MRYNKATGKFCDGDAVQACEACEYKDNCAELPDKCKDCKYLKLVGADFCNSKCPEGA